MSWNPVTGCTKISEGCKNCYAEKMARRLAGRCGYPEAPHHFDVTLHPDRLDEPLRWKKPRTVFVCSMSDIGHPDIPDGYLAAMLGVMSRTPQHTYLLLTKRPQNLSGITFYAPEIGMGENIWVGVTIENQRQADERVPLLLQIPAAVRFVSCEPLLGPVDISEYLPQWTADFGYHPGGGQTPWTAEEETLIKSDGLDQVIVGCESGPKRRIDSNWWTQARAIKDQCVDAGVSFFLKQGPDEHGRVIHLPKLDGQIWNEWPKRASV